MGRLRDRVASYRYLQAFFRNQGVGSERECHRRTARRAQRNARCDVEAEEEIQLQLYKSKEELKAEINKTFEKYISEFDSIPEALKDKRVDEVDRTPAENLAYQVGWTTLVLKWEEDEREGLQVKTPSDEFKWNQLGELYQWFTDTYAHLSLQELKAELNENVKSICAMIDSLSADELFKPHMRKWADDATKAAVWEAYRFIHVNTVAPFGTFRTKIRKWKKAAL